MKNEYDLFEKFPNGSSFWRGSVSGYESTRLRLEELRLKSENKFYAISLTTREVLDFHSESDAPKLLAPLKAERCSKKQVA
jgi:hypothetical protein